MVCLLAGERTIRPNKLRNRDLARFFAPFAEIRIDFCAHLPFFEGHCFQNFLGKIRPPIELHKCSADHFHHRRKRKWETQRFRWASNTGSPPPPIAGAEQRSLLVRQPVREGRRQDEPRGAHRRRPRGFGAFLGADPERRGQSFIGTKKGPEGRMVPIPFGVRGGTGRFGSQLGAIEKN